MMDNEKKKTQRPWNIYVVEDNPGDVLILREALREIELPTNFEVAHAGDVAIERLRYLAAQQPASIPDLILLDLNIPGMGGIEVLQALKSDPVLQVIPVLILSTSNRESDVMDSYRLHANSYLQKPTEFQRFVTMVGAIYNFWYRQSVSPAKPVH